MGCFVHCRFLFQNIHWIPPFVDFSSFLKSVHICILLTHIFFAIATSSTCVLVFASAHWCLCSCWPASPGVSATFSHPVDFSVYLTSGGRGACRVKFVLFPGTLFCFWSRHTEPGGGRGGGGLFTWAQSPPQPSPVLDGEPTVYFSFPKGCLCGWAAPWRCSVFLSCVLPPLLLLLAEVRRKRRAPSPRTRHGSLLCLSATPQRLHAPGSGNRLWGHCCPECLVRQCLAMLAQCVLQRPAGPWLSRRAGRPASLAAAPPSARAHLARVTPLLPVSLKRGLGSLLGLFI